MKKEISKAYEPAKYEDKIYKKWEQSGYFNPDNLSLPKNVKNYSIIMPPANVTGTLHMGHAVMLAIEDILIRYHRLKGERALWIPGTDHAAIATQTKVEKILKNKGTDRHKLGREKFLKEVEKFAQDSHDTIVNQVKKMGSSCDWSREAYTLDETRTKAVRSVFKMMYDDGLIYRGQRVVNWCPGCHSTLADDEVEYKEEKGKIYWLKYGPFVLATARPETKLGDTAVAVHPGDKRYKKMVGKKYMIPGVLGEFEITVVADKSVDPEFGSGAIKVTPAHSFVDSEIAARHGISAKQIINEDGKMMANCGQYAGLTTGQARAAIVSDMEKMGLIDHIDENYTHNIAVCYRCGAQIEPLPSKQWFIDVNKKIPRYNKSIKELSIEAVKKGVFGRDKIRIVPERFEKNYYHWLENLRDWCVSRQIWFGHQVPVWYRTENKEQGTRKQENNINITYFPHGTTIDNENNISTGWNQGELSRLGIKQSKELWDKIKDKKFDVVICSDLKRAVDSATLAFKGKIKIIKDKRLRECNYGDLNGEKTKKMDLLKPNYIETPFPNGESYRDVEERMRDFLNNISKKYSNKKVVIISHHAPQLALEVIVKGKTWEQAIDQDWRHNKAWQAGWEYKLESAVAGISARKIWDLKIYGRDIFKGLVDGTKKIETRAGRPRGNEKYWGDFKPGDIIEFSLADAKTDKVIKNINSVRKLVKRVKHFNTIAGMFEIYKSEDNYPGKTGREIVRWWNKYPLMADRIKEYGIWVIELAEPIESKNKTELILVRHGQTDWNKNGIMQGQKDVPLNNKGARDARKLAEKIKNEKFDIIITSPLKRTSQTAELLNTFGVKIIQDDRLKERHYGKFEGKKTNEILKKHPEITTFKVNGLPYWIDVPTAETYDEVRARVKDFLEDIKKKYVGQRIMVVSHGDTLDMFYAILNNLPNEKAYGHYSLNMRLEKYELGNEEIYVGVEPPAEKTNFVFLHGFKRTDKVVDPLGWLNQQVFTKNNFCENLPNAHSPNRKEQAEFVLKNAQINENTVIVTHSLGGILALKIIEENNIKIKKLVMVAPVYKPRTEELRDYKGDDFNFNKINKLIGEVIIFQDLNDLPARQEDNKFYAGKLKDAKLIAMEARVSHFNCKECEEILDELRKDIWVQDKDTLDTWFSSGLWTFSTMGWPGGEIKILATRHGNTNAHGNKFIGQEKEVNKNLNKEGKKQAEELAEKLKNEKIDLIFSSDLKRTVQTAEIINKYHNLEIIKDKRLREYRFGFMSGLTKEEVRIKYPDAPGWKEKEIGHQFLDEERPIGVKNRVDLFLNDLKNKYVGKKVLVVTGSGVLDFFDMILNKKKFSEIKNLSHKKCEVESYKIKIDDDFKNFHPTAVLETGYDILFFWVARMIIMTTYAVGDIPFKDVYLHGLVRDEKGRKMSKSLDNAIDPLEMIKKYGTDATRLSLVIGSTPGGDINLSEAKVAGFRNFANKLWNISRYLIGYFDNFKNVYGQTLNKKGDYSEADRWIIEKIKGLILVIGDDLDNYRFSQAGERLKKFTWVDLADKYLEVSKFERTAYKGVILRTIIEDLLKLWHPFMPFVTEAINSEWKEDWDIKKDLIIEDWPDIEKYKSIKTSNNFELIINLITAIRNVRYENKVEPKKKVKAIIYVGKYKKLIESQAHLIKGLRTGIKELKILEKGSKIKNEIYISVNGIDIYLIGAIDKEKEKVRLKKEKDNLEKMIKIVEKKLANKNFIAKAPKDIVDLEKKKLRDWKNDLKKL